jgi:diacylglycerol kinase family enzyme
VAIPVIFNPNAGKKRAQRRLEQWKASLASAVEFWPTEHPGHAEQLALLAAQQGHDVVAAAGGDGTVHEVANGLLQSGRTDVGLAILPIGSANDYFYSVQRETEPEEPGGGRRVDVGVIREPGGRERYFVCCLGLGFNGMVTREARRTRDLQGVALYAVAAVRAMWNHFDYPQMTLSFDEQPPIVAPTLMLSLMIGKREGGFVMAPRASLCDGLFDHVHARQLSRFQVLTLLPRLALFGVPDSYPQVAQGRCRRLHLQSPKPLIAHIDGEFFCQPEDGIQELEIELLPRRLPVFCQLPVPAAR